MVDGIWQIKKVFRYYKSSTSLLTFPAILKPFYSSWRRIHAKKFQFQLEETIFSPIM